MVRDEGARLACGTSFLATANMPYAAATSSNPLGAARAAASGFVATAPNPGWELYGPAGVAGDLRHRDLDWTDRCTLAASGDASGRAGFLEVLCRRFSEFSALDSLTEVLSPLTNTLALEQSLHRLASECFKPARPTPAERTRNEVLKSAPSRQGYIKVLVCIEADDSGGVTIKEGQAPSPAGAKSVVMEQRRRVRPGSAHGELCTEA